MLNWRNQGKNVKDLIGIKSDPKNKAGKKRQSSEPSSYVHLKGFNRSQEGVCTSALTPPMLWFLPPQKGGGITYCRTPGRPSCLSTWCLWCLLGLKVQNWKHLKGKRNAWESLQWVSTLMLTPQLSGLEPALSVTWTLTLPNPKRLQNGWLAGAPANLFFWLAFHYLT